jgi:hypothetical protein
MIFQLYQKKKALFLVILPGAADIEFYSDKIALKEFLPKA